MTNYQLVREFHQAFRQGLDEHWERFSYLDNLRRALVKEETCEVFSASDKENLLKELVDLLYVTYGYAATFGLDVDEAFWRVHKSNMSKLGDDGKPIYRDDGKVLKGPNYEPPYLKDLV